jgi:hypothetical protein
VLAAALGSATRLWNLDTGEPLGTLLMLRAGSSPAWLALTPEGHYRCSLGLEKELVCVVEIVGRQELLSPEEFAKKYGWMNDPDQVRLREK